MGPRSPLATAGRGTSPPLTWSHWLVCLTRNLRKLKREHFRIRMRSEDPSPKWAAGERPWGLRGQAQDMLVALMARNFPQTTFHSSTSSKAKRGVADGKLDAPGVPRPSPQIPHATDRPQQQRKESCADRRAQRAASQGQSCFAGPRGDFWKI